MAGAGEERVWRFCDDPAHAWVRASWQDQAVDPRLPMTSTTEPPTDEPRTGQPRTGQRSRT
ncbi:MAG: hypothetical protein ACM3ZF_02930, partial [Mycobacterium leprae]